MMNSIKRLLRRVLRLLISYYDPAVLTVLFVVVQGLFLLKTPFWPVPLFFVSVTVMLYRFVRF